MKYLEGGKLEEEEGREARHYPEASWNYKVDLKVVNLGSTSMGFKLTHGLNVCVLGDYVGLYFELMCCCYEILLADFLLQQ